MGPTVEEILSPEGAIARRIEGYEVRPEQLEMARHVEAALAGKANLLIEAGTGVGKSFAYLLPAIRYVASHAGQRIVISTNTISLQEQIMEKDLPVLQAAVPEEFTAVLVKGRGNYLSLRRLQLASARQDSLFPNAGQRHDLHLIEDWAYETLDGTLATLPAVTRLDVWDRVQSDADNCMGRRCPNYKKCFYQTARRRMERANILVCNHALFFSDLAMRAAGKGFLPDYQHVILDEAHHIEETASEHFGVSLSEGRVLHLLNVLYSSRRGRDGIKGFLATLRLFEHADESLGQVLAQVDRCRVACQSFFDQLVQLFAQRTGRRNEETNVRLREPGLVDDTLSAPMRNLALRLRNLKESVEEEEDAYELHAYAERASSIAIECEALVEQKIAGSVYWIEVSGGVAHRGGRRRVKITCSPVEVAPVLKEHLFDREVSTILTSATLTTGRDDFTHIRRAVGCEEGEAIRLGSPFNYAEQARVIVETQLPDPGDADYVEKLLPVLLKHLRATDGGAFVLFTSFAMLNKVAQAMMQSWGERHGGEEEFPLLLHGQDGPRGLLLKRFREDERSVLLGTASFWQGVDVRGKALRNVIITRLPFDVPDRPLIQARFDLIKQRGGDPFRDDSIPRAVIRFKQGFGRLIRSHTDNGRFVVLDKRVVTRGYGRKFLEALPEDVPIDVYPGTDE